MPKIRISSAARAVIHASVTPGREFKETATAVAPDIWEVEVEQITLDALEAARRRAGLVDYSDAILWLSQRPRH